MSAFAPRRSMFPDARAKRMTVRFPSHLAAVGFFHSRHLAQADLTTSTVEVFMVRGSDEAILDLIASAGGEVVS